MLLKQKSILITGASSGIGLELARQLAPDNRLVLVARRLELLQQFIQSLPEITQGRHLILQCDVSDYKQVQSTFKKIVAEKIEIEIAILNAGTSRKFSAQHFSLKHIEETFAVNFWGGIYWIDQLLPEMIRRNQGLIAVNGSLAGYRGMPAAAPYSASKAAIATFLESLRVDLIHTNVCFTLISPGFVDTPMVAHKKNSLPFLVPVTRATRIIIRGLEKRKTEIHFPYALSIPAKLARFLPNIWFAKLIHGRH